MVDTHPKDTLYLVDGTSQLYRAYFAIRGLTNDDGLPTNAIYGFATMLRKLLREQHPSAIGVAFDLPGPVFRNRMYSEYKANRPPTPEDLRPQMPYAKRVCEVLGITVLERAGFEADDLLASYAERAAAEGADVVLVASDKDVLQLVSDRVKVFNPTKEIWLDASGVVEAFGVPPEQVLDVQGLMGDSVDNIPGVPGVGEKTAVSIVATYGDVEAVIARSERFVTLFDRRDRLLAAIDAADKSSDPGAELGGIEQAVATTREAAGRFVEDEADASMRDRVAGVVEALAGLDLDALREAVAEKGRAGLKPVKALKKDLKALDRGSSRKVWYAIHRNEADARLSKELARLDRAVPDLRMPAELERRPPEPEAVAELFGFLGFKSLVEEFAEHDGTHESPPPASAPGPSGDYTTVLTAGALGELVLRATEARRCALHLEVEGGDPMRGRLVGIALSSAEAEGAYVPVAHDYLGAPDQLAVESVAQQLGPLFADNAVLKSGHDVKSMAHVLRRHGMPIDVWELDTMVAAFLVDASKTSYPIQQVAADYLDHAIASRADLLGSGSARRPPREVEVDELRDLAAETADIALRLTGALAERLREADLAELYETVDGPLLPVLERTEDHGLKIDTDRLAVMSEEMGRTLERLGREIHELAGRAFNVDSPKQVREVLFEDLGLKPRRKTAKSKVASTDAQTLEEFAEDHEIARKLLEYRETSKLKGTYVDSLPRLVNPDTGRVHTHFHPTGAATGRLSSSDPNLQNIPVRTEAGREIRSAFVAAPGWSLLASDYSQIELRVLAHMCEDPELIAAFQAGEDIHRHTAARVFGVLPDLVTDAMRRRAKAVNFGLLYGMSEARLAREQGLTRSEAKDFVQTYFDRFASVRGYIDRVRAEANERAQVSTLFGRIRPFPQLRQRVHRGIREQALRAAVNTTLQGTAADLMKLAMIRVDAELAQAGLGAKILLQVHDELLLEVPDDRIDVTRERVREAMEGVYPLKVPLVVDQKVGKNWRDV